MTKRVLIIAALLFAALVAVGVAPAADARQSANVCRVSNARGADVGALVNACDRRLGAGAGTIIVSGGGNVATRVVVSPRHTLEFAGGVYTATTPGAVIFLKDSSALRCDSWDAVLEESTAEARGGVGADGSPVFTIVADFAGGTRNGDASSGITVSGCHFRGARRDFNSAPQTVSLGNCSGCAATGNYFDHTRTIGLQIGGGAMYGNLARGAVLDGNTFRGVASQNLAVTNGADVHVTNNRFYAPGAPGGPGVSVIDVEPNAGDTVDGVDISRNLIDATEGAIDGGGWKTTNAIVINGSNPTKKFAGVVIRDNTIVAGRRDAAEVRVAYADILLRAAWGVVVSGNRINRGERCVLLDGGSHDNLVERNTIENCGSGSTFPIHLQEGVVRNRVLNNVLTADPSDGMGANLVGVRRERAIVEDPGADDNIFSGNTGDVTLSGRRSRVDGRTRQP